MLDIKIFNNLQGSFETKDLLSLEQNLRILIDFIRETNYLDDKTFYHPLGFIYSKLYTFPNFNTIRLHIWDKERWYQEPLMDIHNHFYTVNSYIITGKMINNIYEIIPEKEPNYSIYKGSYNSINDRVLTKTEEYLHVVLSEVQQIEKCNLYHIATDKIHSSSIAMDTFTCTLVYTTNHGSPEPMVLGPLNGKKEYKYLNKLVDKQTVEILVDKLASR